MQAKGGAALEEEDANGDDPLDVCDVHVRNAAHARLLSSRWDSIRDKFPVASKALILHDGTAHACNPQLLPKLCANWLQVGMAASSEEM